jgi:hypothetical protein
MVIGYTIYGHDNDSYMIDELAPVDALTCTQCGFLKDQRGYFHNPFFKLKKKVFDFSSPYDTGKIVSLKFKEFCVRENYKGIQFKEFEREAGFFQLVVNNIVEFDAKRAKTEFLDICPKCKNYQAVIGTVPPFLKKKPEELADGFYRTDLVFGSGNSKNPLTLIGPDTAKKLKREKMKGIVYVPIES